MFPSQFEITRVGNLRLIVQYCTFHLYLTTSVSRNINICTSVSVGRLNYSKLFVEEENEGEERERERENSSIYIILPILSLHVVPLPRYNLDDPNNHTLR